jgi:hypothetical protein
MPLVKAALRVALYPLIGFSYLLISGYLPVAAGVLLLTVFLFLRFRRQIKASNLLFKRSEC